jgi:hypothetical protein
MLLYQLLFLAQAVSSAILFGDGSYFLTPRPPAQDDHESDFPVLRSGSAQQLQFAVTITSSTPIEVLLIEKWPYMLGSSLSDTLSTRIGCCEFAESCASLAETDQRHSFHW